jgi:hypothetical protein
VSTEDDVREEARRGRTTMLGELLRFLAENKKWWITPILIVMVVLGLLVFLGGTGAAPFVYTLF